jgi:hypothetical protein
MLSIKNCWKKKLYVIILSYAILYKDGVLDFSYYDRIPDIHNQKEGKMCFSSWFQSVII